MKRIHGFFFNMSEFTFLVCIKWKREGEEKRVVYCYRRVNMVRWSIRSSINKKRAIDYDSVYPEKTPTLIIFGHCCHFSKAHRQWNNQYHWAYNHKWITGASASDAINSTLVCQSPLFIRWNSSSSNVYFVKYHVFIDLSQSYSPFNFFSLWLNQQRLLVGFIAWYCVSFFLLFVWYVLSSVVIGISSNKHFREVFLQFISTLVWGSFPRFALWMILFFSVWSTWSTHDIDGVLMNCHSFTILFSCFNVSPNNFWITVVEF